MNLAVAQEACVFEAGDQAQDAGLFSEFQMVLKADDIVAVSAQILFAELDDCPWRLAGAWIAQAYGLHGTKAKCVAAAAGEDFNG